jgi:hypothetical protein
MTESNNNNQAVIVHLRLSDDEFGTPDERMAAYELEDKLIETINSANVGELDGHEFGGGEVVFYMYGTSADRLFAAVETILQTPPFPTTGYAIRRYGPPGSNESQVELTGGSAR